MGATASSPRLVSLDQFRGYTVLGMFLVNFVGSFAAVKESLPLLKHHHTYCSYADTIMPQFFFAVGFAWRLTFLRRRDADGPAAAYAHSVRRIAALLLVAFIVHHVDGRYEFWADLQKAGLAGVLSTAFQRTFFQTLTHIAITSLWILPVIAAGPLVRVAYMIVSAALFHLLSASWYYQWEMTRPGIDGGPLGFLTWTIPTIVGTLAFDALSHGKPRVARLVNCGVFLMLLGYGLSCLNRVMPPNLLAPDAPWTAVLVEPPFVPPSLPVNIWTMSQRAGSVSYLTFGAGLSLALYALFVVACDRGSLQLGLFRTLGTNALAGYILHELVAEAIKPLVPGDSPLWYVGLALAAFLGICYAVLRYLEKERLFLKL
jgi:predicted acyltransferase